MNTFLKARKKELLTGGSDAGGGAGAAPRRRLGGLRGPRPRPALEGLGMEPWVALPGRGLKCSTCQMSNTPWTENALPESWTVSGVPSACR